MNVDQGSEPARCGHINRRSFLHLDYPGPEREREIIRLGVPGLDAALAGQAARIVHALRSHELDKPSFAPVQYALRNVFNVPGA